MASVLGYVGFDIAMRVFDDESNIPTQSSSRKRKWDQVDTSSDTSSQSDGVDEERKSDLNMNALDDADEITPYTLSETIPISGVDLEETLDAALDAFHVASIDTSDDPYTPGPDPEDEDSC